MQFLKSIKTFVTSLVLLCFLWLIFIITSVVSEHRESENDLFIPESATFALRIDGRKLAENTLFSVLLEAKDEEIIEKFNDLIEESKEKGIQDLGINFLSDLVYFSAPYKTGTISGFSLNLTNSEDFKSHITPLLNSHQTVEVIKNVGIILSYTPYKGSSPISKNDLISYFNKHISPQNGNIHSPFNDQNKSKKFIQAYSKGNLFGQFTCFSASDLQFEMLDAGINMDGKLQISPKQSISISKRVLIPQKNDLHFSTSIVPKSLQDSIKHYFSEAGLELPDIEAISMNYKGMNIVNDETGMHTLPQADLLIEFKKTVSLENILLVPSVIEHLGTKPHTGNYRDKIIVGGKNYFIRQIDSHTLYIGITENPVIQENKTNEILNLKGNLSSILKVEGGGMLIAFLEVVPAYKASKQLFNSTRKFDIIICKNSPKDATLKGNIYFKKGHYAMNEILKFVLEGKSSFDIPGIH